MKVSFGAVCLVLGWTAGCGLAAETWVPRDEATAAAGVSTTASEQGVAMPLKEIQSSLRGKADSDFSWTQDATPDSLEHQRARREANTFWRNQLDDMSGPVPTSSPTEIPMLPPGVITESPAPSQTPTTIPQLPPSPPTQAPTGIPITESPAPSQTPTSIPQLPPSPPTQAPTGIPMLPPSSDTPAPTGVPMLPPPPPPPSAPANGPNVPAPSTGGNRRKGKGRNRRKGKGGKQKSGRRSKGKGKGGKRRNRDVPTQPRGKGKGRGKKGGKRRKKGKGRRELGSTPKIGKASKHESDTEDTLEQEEENVEFLNDKIVNLTSDLVPSDTSLERKEPWIPLPIYWINLDRSTERRAFMEERFSNLTNLGHNIETTRVPATDTDQIQTLLATGRVSFKDVTIVPANADTFDWEKHSKKEFTEIEAATLVSHLRAILMAYKAGHEYALIVEDDIIFSSTFFSNWRAYSELAPSDWSVLQWSTSNEAIEKETSNFANDPWISWLPDYYGCTGYMVRRKGMKEILRRSFSEDIFGNALWRIDEPGLVVADEVVYYLASQSYTSTTAWIGTSGLISTHDEGHLLTEIHLEHSIKIDRSEMKLMLRSERVLVVMTCRIKDEPSILKEIERLKMDAESLSRWHSESRWIVNAVVPNDHLKTLLLESALDLTASISLRVHVNEQTFNKFSFIDSATKKEFFAYDYVLFKDNDMRLTGFPWNTFMERKGDTVVSAPLHEAVEESLSRHALVPKRQWYQFHEAQMWRQKQIPEFVHVTPVPTMYTEQSFALMRGDFAYWFFDQALTPWFVAQPTDWGIDKMWCGAAKSFRPELRSCEIVPVVAVHEDTRQITVGEDYLKKGRSAIERFREDDRIRDWLDDSIAWETFIEGNANLTVIKQRCKELIHSEVANITKCAELIVDGKDNNQGPS